MSPGLRLSVRALTLLLFLFPRGFRRRYGREMVEAFEDRYLDLRRSGGWPLPRCWLRSLPDLLRAGLRARVDEVRPGRNRRSTSPEPRSSGGGQRRVARGPRLDGFRQDLRFALRGLAQRPGFAVVAIATLALGIGGNTAIFSVVNGVLLRPLPYHDAERLVAIGKAYGTDLGEGDLDWYLSQPDLRDIQQRVDALEASFGYSPSGLTLTGMGEAEVVRGARVTDGTLATFGLAPALGRDLRSDENVPGGPDVVVISQGFWQERLGGDPDVVGRKLQLNGRPFEIVGVAPEGFAYPEGTHLWIPRHHDLDGCGRGCHVLRVVARLGPEASVARSDEEVHALSLQLGERYPDTNVNKRFGALALRELVVGDVRGGLLLMLGAVALVLLIACANVANLLLVRGSARTGEIAVRTALGAGRARVFQQLLIENLLLAAGGGIAGVLLARAGLAGLLRLAPEDLPRLGEVSLDFAVLAFAAGLVILVTMLFGLAPALRLAATPVTETLAQSGARGSVASRFKSRGRSALLAAEVALSVLLLMGAGLLLRSFDRLQRVDIGFDPDRLLRFEISLPAASYPAPEDAIELFESLEERLVALPEVRSAGSAFGSPMGANYVSTSIRLHDRPEPPTGEAPSSVIRVVTHRYFDTLGLPLLAGRGLRADDRIDVPLVAVVNRAFVEEFYPDGGALGQELGVGFWAGYRNAGEIRTIVGVVDDVRSVGLAREPQPEVYLPQGQMGIDYMAVMVRTETQGTDVLASIRSQVRGVDPNLPLRNVALMSDVVTRQAGSTRFYLALLGCFAGVAIVLAGVGLYGVIAYLVSQRSREIAIRVALGAEPGRVARLVFAQGMRPALLGLGAGIAGGLLAGQLMTSLLYRVPPHDPTAFGLAAVVVATVATLAIHLPARRAAGIAPASALKEE